MVSTMQLTESVWVIQPSGWWHQMKGKCGICMRNPGHVNLLQFFDLFIILYCIVNHK